MYENVTRLIHYKKAPLFMSGFGAFNDMPLRLGQRCAVLAVNAYICLWQWR